MLGSKRVGQAGAGTAADQVELRQPRAADGDEAEIVAGERQIAGREAEHRLRRGADAEAQLAEAAAIDVERHGVALVIVLALQLAQAGRPGLVRITSLGGHVQRGPVAEAGRALVHVRSGDIAAETEPAIVVIDAPVEPDRVGAAEVVEGDALGEQGTVGERVAEGGAEGQAGVAHGCRRTVDALALGDRQLTYRLRGAVEVEHTVPPDLVDTRLAEIPSGGEHQRLDLGGAQVRIGALQHRCRAARHSLTIG